MVYRLQYVFLTFALLGGTVSADDAGHAKMNNDFFSLGVSVGFINIQDFNSELTLGFNGRFNASEDYFLAFNYFQADSAQSSFEKSQGQLFSGADRTFSHYDFLVGYNVFQAEFFADDQQSSLSTLYAVAGAGETEFGGEQNFTLTIGLGYRFSLNRDYHVSVDYRDYLFKSSLLEEDSNTHNTQIALSVGYLF